METYDDEVLKTFLDRQEQLFDERVADTLEEAEAFLEDCMAVVVDSEAEVFEYFEENGMDVSEASDVDDIAEVFRIPDGRFLIVEG
ncbi:MAG TPA: glyoxalase [Lachnospiraceae bacterium]|nr:glyoxalase [Lachnospiraceae bacterium]